MITQKMSFNRSSFTRDSTRRLQYVFGSLPQKLRFGNGHDPSTVFHGSDGDPHDCFQLHPQQTLETCPPHLRLTRQQYGAVYMAASGMTMYRRR
jgi:hypothetical protein